MAEQLSAASWSAYTKKQKLEKLGDDALLKALAKFDKAEKLPPAARVDILDEVVDLLTKQIVLLAKRKKDLGDDLFNQTKAKLYALQTEAERLQKTTRAEAARSASEDDEPDTPALLSSKMIPLLAELKNTKGESRMSAMICTAGKNTSVLIMRTPIAASRRKILADAVDAKGGMKYIEGECLYENGVLTFVLKSPAGGLAARVHQAILGQTGKKLRVKVRGEDGATDEGGEDGRDTQDGQDAPGPAAQDAQTAPSAEQSSYAERLRNVQVRLDAALSGQHPESTKLRALIGFASEKADGHGDFAAAHKALDAIEKLLGAASPTATTAPSEWQKRLAQIEQRYLEVLRAQPANASQLRAAMAEATGAAESGDPARAERALTRVATLLDEASTQGKETDVIPEGIVARMKAAFEEAQTRWESGVSNAKDSMRPVQAGLTGAFADAAPAIDRILDSYRRDLTDLLQDAKAAQDQVAVTSMVRQTLTKVGELRAEIARETLFVYLDGHGAPVSPAFNAALDDIETLLNP